MILKHTFGINTRQMVRVVAKNMNNAINVYDGSMSSLIINAIGTPTRQSTNTLYTLIPKNICYLLLEIF